MKEIASLRDQAGEQLVWDEIPDIIDPILGIDDRPSNWAETLLYAWQHTLVDITPLVFPFVVGVALGMTQTQMINLVSWTLIAMGVATLMQTTLGNKLPIIQGPSITVGSAMMSVGAVYGIPAMWGAVFAGGLIEAGVGASGTLGFLRKLFPVTVAGIVITCIGLNLGMTSAGWMIGDGNPTNIAIGALAIIMILLLQLKGSKIAGGILGRGAIFFTIWTVGLGVSSALGLVNWSVVAERPWIALPSLFPNGGPGFGWKFILGAIVGIVAGYIGSIVESVGDYAATCAVSGEKFRVRHMNRGIATEGLACVLASCIGALPVTSYTQNIGIIATTRVASRYVVQVAAVIILAYGLSPKFGALLAVVPRPVLGGVFMLVCGSIVMSGLKLIFSAVKTERNATLVGLTLLIALGIPAHLKTPAMQTWLISANPFLKLLCTNTVVLSVICGILINLLLNHLLGEEKITEQSK